MQRFGMMSKVIAVVTGVTLAVAALVTAVAQDAPPHTFYGHNATPGDTIAAVVAHGDHYDTVDSTTVGDDGSWSLEVPRDMADEIEFTLNGEHAHVTKSEIGAGLTEVSDVHVDEPMMDDAMDDDDSMMEDDDDSMMEDDDDSMMEDDDSMMEDDDDSMMEDDDSMMEDDDGSMMEDDEMEDDEMLATDPPTTGSGGLADNGGISAGLIGLLIALGAAAVAGLGVRRVRNRA